MRSTQRPTPRFEFAIEQTWKVAGTRDQIETADFVYDAREKCSLRILPGDPLRDHPSQRRDVGRVFPQAPSQCPVLGRARHALHLLNHEGGSQHTQGLETES
jgi:hypothetical protein